MPKPTLIDRHLNFIETWIWKWRVASKKFLLGNGWQTKEWRDSQTCEGVSSSGYIDKTLVNAFIFFIFIVSLHFFTIWIRNNWQITNSTIRWKKREMQKFTLNSSFFHSFFYFLTFFSELSFIVLNPLICFFWLFYVIRNPEKKKLSAEIFTISLLHAERQEKRKWKRKGKEWSFQKLIQLVLET